MRCLPNLDHWIRNFKRAILLLPSSEDACNFKYALHAAVMDYNQGIQWDDKLLSIDTIKTILINIGLYLQCYVDNHTDKIIKLVLPLMGCSVGGLVKIEVLECYRDFFQKDVEFDCEVIVYRYSQKDYELAKSFCNSNTMVSETYSLLFQNKHIFMMQNDQK